MENAADSLKMAFGVLVFVVALSLSISTFSTARSAIDSITMNKDKTQSYVYIKTSNSKNRDVGIETIIPALYKAYSENYRVEFYVKDSQNGPEKKVILYSKNNLENKGEGWIEVNYIDLEEENFASEELAIEHLNTLLTNGKYKFENSKNELVNKKISDYDKKSTSGVYLYKEEIGSKSGSTGISGEGLYSFLKNKTFEEKLGEYYQEDKNAGYETESLEINKTKKRVITYIWKNY